MKYIADIKEGDRVKEIYLCRSKQTLVSKNGRSYDSLVLQDKTGSVDGKIWDLSSGGIEDFDKLDYIEVTADVTSFQGSLQLNIRRVRRAEENECDPSEYLPSTERDIEEMYLELTNFRKSIQNEYLKKLLSMYFLESEFLKKKFCFHSAAKSVHHGYVGGLLEHTLAVTKNCEYMSGMYPILNRDLLLTAAMLHDIGKIAELSEFPENDYTDDGQLLGHIVIGCEWISATIKKIEGFPKTLALELKHCIIAHHGQLEFGSPKKPALVEALALSFADNLDAKMETMKEALAGKQAGEWVGYHKFLETNIRGTVGE